jgi:hypothetical protein
MTKTIWTGTFSAVIAGAAITVLAQTQPPPQSTQTPTPPQSSSPSADRITVTGCLKAAPSAAAETNTTAGTTGTSPTATTGTTGATGAAAPTDSTEAKFVLADATTSPAKAETGSAPAAPETTTAPGTSASAQHTQTYRLVANPAALTPHVGKKLELTGTLVDQTASTTASASGPALKVESGKVLAASCQE